MHFVALYLYTYCLVNNTWGDKQGNGMHQTNLREQLLMKKIYIVLLLYYNYIADAQKECIALRAINDITYVLW